MTVTAPFQVDIEKLLSGEYWTNRYYVDVADLGAAVTLGLDIVDTEKAVHSTLTLFTKMRASSTAPDDGIYSINVLNAYGTHDIGGDYLPLFNVVRVDFTAAGGGRPSRKYLRVPMGEAEQTAGQLTSAAITYYTGNYAEPMLLLSGFCDPQQQVFAAANVYPFVGMRQLRRGSRRRTLPVL